jgi:hypothetical protein
MAVIARRHRKQCAKKMFQQNQSLAASESTFDRTKLPSRAIVAAAPEKIEKSRCLIQSCKLKFGADSIPGLIAIEETA